MAGWKEGNVAPAKLNATVVVSKFQVQSEPVSPRLVRSLPHPDRTSSISTVVFNPDGQLIVSGYPSGIVQVLNPATGKELRTIETQRGFRSSLNYLKISKDFRTLFVSLVNMKAEAVQVGERKTYYRRYEGETRVYDLVTGEQKEPLRVEPRRGVHSLILSPDASRVVSTESTSGRVEDFAKLGATYLWDMATRQAVKLRDGYGYSWFSQDGKTVFIFEKDQKDKTGAIYAYSAVDGKELSRQTIADEPGHWFSHGSDSKGKIASTSVDTKSKKPTIRLYNPDSFELEGVLTADEVEGQSGFGGKTFSPDNKRLAAVANSTVFLWDVESRKLLKSWRLDTLGRIRNLKFDSKGERLAISTLHLPPELGKILGETPSALDLPQPKVFLIDVNSDKIETIICPHGLGNYQAFSPDGRLLAVGGTGATHIFNVEKK